jgi:4-hydroxybenzoate polyprenyltransferase
VIKLLYQIVRTARPRQWLKNLAVFAVPLFHGVIFEPNVLGISFLAFLDFCIIASGTYILNDLVDAPRDRQHPIKKNRPIASRKLSVKAAVIAMLILYAWGLYMAFTNIGTYFGFVAISYILIQIAYSFYFRNVIILDALIVSAGFILRVFAGGVAVNISVSSWLILTTIGLSLLLAFGKRRSEKTILEKHAKEIKSTRTRRTLRYYPDSLLDSIISMSSSFCILSYSLFTFQTSPNVQGKPINNLLPSILKTPKFMMLTIPVVIYGVARYLYLIYEKKEGESPERVLLSDAPLLGTVILWGTMIFFIVYVLPGV